MHTNALIHEKSPYLQQHAHNPVEWLPWGETAFEKARREDKPIFLSIGYSTCHWCHVMAHESFEDETIAEILNRDFVPVKLDREERPDIDRIYMLFVQASTGSGGWPMSVWLTPQLKPFFGGTYFPPDNRYGRPGFGALLQHLSRAWKQDRARIEESGDGVTDQLRSMAASASTGLIPDKELFAAAFWQFRRAFDKRWGGFGGAPKFPRPVVFNYLLRYYAMEKDDDALEMVLTTLRAMAAGGMHDHLGGGFHRYSVDEQWFVPHFEKMLYDQAQLAVSYLEAYQVTHQEEFADVARDIFTYVLRDLTDPLGGFYSAEDADSPNPDDPSHSGEGAFYIWTYKEIQALLGQEDAALFCKHYGVRPEGNVEQDPHGEFTGRNILFEAFGSDQDASRDASELASSRQVLFEARAERPRPHLDKKILTSWNGLMISALAKGYSVLGDPKYLVAAERAAAFLLSTMYVPESGDLLRRFCDGEAGVPAFLDDYTFLAQGLLDLFEASFEPSHLQTAIALMQRAVERFEDTEAGGFFSTAEGGRDLLLRIKDDYDGAEPSGNSVATDMLLRLGHLTGTDHWQKSAERSLHSFAPKLKVQPTMAPQMLVAVGRELAEPSQIVIRCPVRDAEIQQRVADYRSSFEPYSIVLALDDNAADQLATAVPFLSSLDRKSRIAIYRCHNFSCELPELVA